jgi:chitinase domain-containing protein 1
VWHEISILHSAGQTEFSILGEKDESFVNSSKNKFKLVPRLIISRTHPRAFLNLIHSDDLIKKLSETIYSFAKSNEYHGLVFEFWLQGLGILQGFEDYNEYRSLHLRLLTKIASYFKSKNLISILTLPPMRNNEITPREFLSLSTSFERINLMTYDYSPANPGPNSPIPWISETLSTLFDGQEIESKKILLGIPFYGYDYKTTKGKAVTGKEFIEILAEEVHDIWNEDDKEHGFHYKANGKDCIVYYPTLDMIRERLNFAKKKGFGVGIWELGQGLEYFFTLF